MRLSRFVSGCQDEKSLFSLEHFGRAGRKIALIVAISETSPSIRQLCCSAQNLKGGRATLAVTDFHCQHLCTPPFKDEIVLRLLSTFATTDQRRGLSRVSGSGKVSSSHTQRYIQVSELIKCHIHEQRLMRTRIENTAEGKRVNRMDPTAIDSVISFQETS